MGNQGLLLHGEQMTEVEFGVGLEYTPPSMPADAPWEWETLLLHENWTWGGNGIWSGPINPQNSTLTTPVACETGCYGCLPSYASAGSAPPDLTTPDPLYQPEVWPLHTCSTAFTNSIGPYAANPYESSGYRTEIPIPGALVASVASPSVSHALEE
jgi:hypothetical protein